MQVYKYVNSINTVSLSGSVSTPSIRGGICRKIIVEAQTAGTAFELNITDDTGTKIRNYPATTTKLDDEYDLIIQGINTVSITNATADGLFTVKMWVEE